MTAFAEQLAWDFDFPLPIRGAISVRHVAAILGRIGAPTTSHPNGKPNDDFVQRLIDENKLVAQIDGKTPKRFCECCQKAFEAKPKKKGKTERTRSAIRITVTSVRAYLASTMTQTPADYRRTLQDAASNLTPAELRQLAAWATEFANLKEEKIREGQRDAAAAQRIRR